MFYLSIRGKGCSIMIFSVYQNQFLKQKKEDMEKITASKATQYKFAQIFGYKGPNQKIMEEDIITFIKFDSSGNYLAVGDKAGRIIVFASLDSKKTTPTYDYFSEFQSHLKEFDPLRSMEVEEEIISINWLKPQGNYLKLITSNERSIKLWKMFQKAEKKVVKSSGKELAMPKLQVVESGVVAELQKPLPFRHMSPINSVSLSSNEEYILSSDESQVFLWSLDNPDKPFVVTNFWTKQEEQGKELITCSKFHPTSDSLFLYGMSKGNLKLADLRTSSNCQESALSFGQPSASQKNYIFELLSSYSSVDFIKNGKYVVSRDCLTLKLWDVCNTKKPLNTVMLNDGIKSKLCEMVQNQTIFDKFSLSASRDGTTILSGSYNNCFHLVDIEEGTNAQYELNYKKSTLVKQISKGNALGKMNYLNRTIAGDFNPKMNLMAVASRNCFFTYSM